jgi:hypothetical protein
MQALFLIYLNLLEMPLRNAVLPQLFDPVKPGGAEALRLT